MQGFGGAQGLHGGVLARQLTVAQKTVDAAVARLAQLNDSAVATALFAGHQMVAGSVLHCALAQATLGSSGLLGTSSSFGGSLLALLTTAHKLGQNE